MESALRFYAVDPNSVLDPSAEAPLIARLHAAFPDAAEVRVQRWESIQFVDNGADLERVVCDLCGSDVLDDWQNLMNDAWSGEGFDDLSIVAPCCGAATSLDRLRYDWPAGFGRFSLDVREPGVTWFIPRRDVPNEAIELLADLIELSGERIGVAWRHL